MREKSLSHGQILRLAISSRLIIITICILGELLVSDHLAEDVADFPRADKGIQPDIQGKAWLTGLLKAFTAWDSAHYLNIAKFGHHSTRVNGYAFLPFFPMMIAELSKHIQGILSFVYMISADDALVFSGLLISNTAFCLGALIFVAMMKELDIDRKYMMQALLCYCFSPASIFFTTVYTESLYLLLSWSAIYLTMKASTPAHRLGRLWLGILLFTLSSFIRSNGILNAIFLLPHLISSSDVIAQLSAALGAVMIVTPLVRYNLYIYEEVCNPIDEQMQCSIDADMIVRELCCQTGHRWFFSYARIQEHYWNVGFLKYYQLKQVPNFLLALPIVILGVRSVWFHGSRMLMLRFSKDKHQTSILMTPVETQLIHLLVMMCIGCFIANVQITTRLLCSSCPLLAIEMGRVLKDGSPREQSCLIAYILTYFTLGTVLHVNFYPWT
jgi:GPI mannosyltransferase 2